MPNNEDGDHHDHEKIVELTSVPTVVEANVLVDELAKQGIKASAATEDSGGLRPNIAFASGVRVSVFENDYERALQIANELNI